MTSQVTFLNGNLWELVLAGVALIYTCFALKELFTTTGKQVWINLSVAFVTITALALIALKPALPFAGDDRPAILLTHDYSGNDIDSLEKVYGKLKKITYSAGSTILPAGMEHNTLFVLGQGVRSFDLWQLEDVNSVYLPDRRPAGIVKLKYSDKLTVGEQLNIQGLYRSDGGDKKLFLEKPGGALADSVAINNSKVQVFHLSTELKVAGAFLFYLVVKGADGKILEREPLPVAVAPGKKFKILMLNAFPTFETKYLKNFLAERGHKVVVRTCITKGKFKYEYLNNASSLQHTSLLSERNLQSFDLLMIDNASMTSFSSSVRKNIENAVQEHGVGLFIAPDDAIFKSSDISVLTWSSDEKETVEVPSLNGLAVTKYPFIIKHHFGVEAVHEADGEIFTAIIPKGKGRLGTTVFKDTYTLLLQGKQKEYRQLWTSVIDRLGKREAGDEWHKDFLVAYPHEPFHFRLETGQEHPKVVGSMGNIAMEQDMDLPGRWYGKLWPRMQGWDSLRLMNDVSTYYYYVADTTAWRSAVTEREMERNRLFFSERKGRPHERELVIHWKAINPLWFLLLFFTGVGYLWLEPKIR